MKTSQYDVWMPSLGPSEALLADFREERITWAVFSRRYRAEMQDSGTADDANRTIKNHGQKFTLRLLRHLAAKQPVTLLCHCPEETKTCHRFLLQKLIERG